MFKQQNVIVLFMSWLWVVGILSSLSSLNLVGWVWAVAGIVGLAGGVWNVFVARELDTAPGWWRVPMAYTLMFVLAPRGGGLTVVTGAIVLVCAVLCLLPRLHLGRSLTIGPSTWVRLVDTGPYAVIRHPCQAANLLFRLAWTVMFPSMWNVVTCLIYIALLVFVIWNEERFLFCCHTWREYAKRVPFRLIPGLW